MLSIWPENDFIEILESLGQTAEGYKVSPVFLFCFMELK
jgi:hypothetical protein